MSEGIVRFETNIPLELALKFDEGKPVEGRFGDQWMYSLTDGRMMYVPPIVATKLGELNVHRGDVFNICKREVQRGKSKKIEWDVWRPEASETHAQNTNGANVSPSAPPPNHHVSPPTGHVNTSANSTNGSKNGTNGNGNGHNGHGAPPSGPTAAAPSPIPPIPTKIPADVAFVEVVRFVQDGLRATGEQWSDQARQDAVSTFLIGAMREGWVAPWRRYLQ